MKLNDAVTKGQRVGVRKFGDFWKYGLPIGIRWLVVETFLMRLF